MPKFALLFGLLLAVLGIASYLEALGPNVGSDGKPSMTALIPTWFGLALMLLGTLSLLLPHQRKHFMHLAAVVGLLGAIGGLVPMIRGGLDLGKASVLAGVLMTLLSAIFEFLCVKSFIDARKARQNASAAPA